MKAILIDLLLYWLRYKYLYDFFLHKIGETLLEKFDYGKGVLTREICQNCLNVLSNDGQKLNSLNYHKLKPH